MCRWNQLWGWALMAFGLGLLLGASISSGFLCNCLGFGGIIIGVIVLRKK